MDAILENSWLQFSIHLDNLYWSLNWRNDRIPGLRGVRMGVDYRLDGRKWNIRAGSPVLDLNTATLPASPHGPLKQARLSLGPDANGIRWAVTFSLPTNLPMLLWQFTLENEAQSPIYVDRLSVLEAGAGLKDSHLDPPSAIGPLSSPAFFSNGWQSWSYAGVYGPGERFMSTRLPFFRSPTDVNAGTPQPKERGRFSSDFFAVLGDRESRGALVAGFLSQRQHFGSLEAVLNPNDATLRMWANGDGARLDPGEKLESDSACLCSLEVDSPDPFGYFVEAVAREHGLMPPLTELTAQAPARSQGRFSEPGFEIPTGWCSWYQYSSEDYTGELSERDVLKNLAALRALQPGLPLRTFQIDDGFEAKVGDWFAFHPAFPRGVAPLAEEIQASGFTPGLWLAPFILQAGSQTARQHPDWLLRGRLGRPVNAGFLWNNFATALDLTHPGALEYVEKTVHTAVHDWGYRYLKLDFLYAAALPGRPRDPRLTRAQILRRGLEVIRAAGEEAFLLGCGCPLGPAIGLVEAMRIGADTSRRWFPYFRGLGSYVHQEWSLPSVRNALNNAIYRAPLHRRWWINDPDCLLLNPGEHLSLEEVRLSASLIAMTGGSLFLSDDLSALPPSLLQIAEVVTPPIGLRPQILDWFDTNQPQHLRLDLENASGSWHLLAQINWADVPQELPFCQQIFGLEAGQRYQAREFWSGSDYSLDGERVSLPPIPPHGVRLLSARPIQPGVPAYLGSNLHISQGLEVAGWEAGDRRLTLALQRPGQARGEIFLRLPEAPRVATIAGRELDWQAAGKESYRFRVEFEREAEIQIEW